jgi:RNA polymerase sigma-70 factor, ECF subfamily
MPDWQEIIDRDGKAVWQTAYRIVGNRADADECFQEAFLAALEVSRREEVRNWRALLQRLATARAVDRLRSRYRQGSQQRPDDWDALPGPAPTASQIVEDSELADWLASALASLPLQQAEVFCLHCREDWSYREIAQHLAITVDSVGVLLHRARKQLRALFDASSKSPSGVADTPAAGQGSSISRQEPP